MNVFKILFFFLQFLFTFKTVYLGGKCTFYKKIQKKCGKFSKFGGVSPPFFLYGI